jgi:hypothetical protein
MAPRARACRAEGEEAVVEGGELRGTEQPVVVVVDRLRPARS